jgi:hypothetical protein
MARNRRNNAAAVRFSPALKIALLFLLIGGAGVGYVWQQGQVHKLGQQRLQAETKLESMQLQNKRLQLCLDKLRSGPALDDRVKKLGLGLGPANPAQVIRLTEPVAKPAGIVGDSIRVANLPVRTNGAQTGDRRQQ